MLIVSQTQSNAATPRPDRPRCAGARKAVLWYRARYNEHRTTMGLSLAPRLERMGCGRARARASYWVRAAEVNRKAAVRWHAYHYRWQDWLPRNWYLLGSCETGYGGPPDFSFANGSFVSAFGISRSIYDSDAAYMGAPPWDDANPPTPREQYLAALGHYRRFGDGWGCPGP